MTALPTIATFDDLNRGAFRQVVAFYASDPDYITERLTQASEWVERSCERRFMPFRGLTQSRVAHGVRPSRGRPGMADVSMVSGIAVSVPSAAFSTMHGAGQVRDFWVDEVPVWAPDLWTYSGVTVDLRYPWTSASYRLDPGMFTGPALDNGHLLLAPGVSCPPGTEVTITYSGGFTPGAYPRDLVEAVRLETVRQLLVELDPELAPELAPERLEEDVDRALCHWRRRCHCGRSAGRSGR